MGPLLIVSGALDHSSTDVRVLELLANPGHGRASDVVLDLSRVRAIDSALLAAVVAADKQLRRAHGRLGLVCTTEPVLDLLARTGLDVRLTVARSREEALDLMKTTQGGTPDGSYH